jgi:hypothetical protein
MKAVDVVARLEASTPKTASFEAQNIAGYIEDFDQLARSLLATPRQPPILQIGSIKHYNRHYRELIYP